MCNPILVTWKCNPIEKPSHFQIPAYQNFLPQAKMCNPILVTWKCNPIQQQIPMSKLLESALSSPPRD